MQFKLTYQQILNGQKIQTRRLVKKGEILLFDDSENTYNVFTEKRLKWRSGKTYAVQPGRGKKSVGRIRIISIRKQKLQGIAGHEVALEGFATLQDFIKAWNKLHAQSGNSWRDNPEVWVLSFLLEGGD